MNDITIYNGIKELEIFEKDNEAWVSSRTISELFQKRHSDVIRAIENITIKKDDFNERNFTLSSYKGKSGKKNKEYLLNRKSFALVVMGFTGEKAIEFKKKYIQAFEDMVTLIQTRLISKAGYKIMCDAVKEYYGNPSGYDYAYEANKVNQIILGMTSKEFREVNQIDDDALLRDNLINDQLEKLNQAQILNSQLLKANVDHKNRSDIIRQAFK